MPEGPELKRSRDEIRDIILGRKIHHMSPTGEGRYRTTLPAGYKSAFELLPLTVEGVDTKGKFMWWTLRSGERKLFMWCTYGMSGQWSPRHRKHTAFIVEHDGGRLHFVDQRRFGTLKFVEYESEHEAKLQSLGPDVLGDPPVALEIFAERILRKPSRNIGETLMDQTCVSGVGNYLRAEILWASRVSPWRQVADLTAAEVLTLHENTLSICRASYESGGSTLYTFEGVDGEPGEYGDRFAVYGRSTDAEGNEVVRESDGDGRTVHWSPSRQK